MILSLLHTEVTLNFIRMSYVLSLRRDFPAKKDWNEYVKNVITTLERKFLIAVMRACLWATQH